MSTRARSWSGALPEPPRAAAGMSRTSAKVPKAAGLQMDPGLTTTVSSTTVPEEVPDTEGKTHTSGASPSGKSRAAARASQTCAGSRGTTGKSVRWRNSSRSASSIFRPSGRRTISRRMGLRASVEVRLTRMPLIFTCAGLGKNLTPILSNCSQMPVAAASGPSATSSGGCGSGWKQRTSSSDGTMSTSVEGFDRRRGCKARASLGRKCCV
mmetsp:Transcript_96465/g.287900  ORF Transcript_96465/g.287900 Transcript_96465/m.287900 type:complete len:211 (+) Transcript_96465:109-741(+)